MALACKNYVVDQDVRSQLAELGLTLELLKDVIKHIGLTMNNHTEDHPSWGPGITTASEAIYALRNILKPAGWQREEIKGFALTIHPDNLIGINIAKGDDGVGDPTADVLSVSDKGICTELAIEKNQTCFDFFQSPIDLKILMPARPTWYLLYARKQDGIHAELSLPMEMAETKQLSGWIKRIILPITRLDGEGQTTAGFDDGGFEVNIRRKSE